ncbi:MAG: hypothetical protein NZ937_03245 [Armatimonadetes bacterium]|nr:hypothetical protein [Armatimonadota bacterium]
MRYLAIFAVMLLLKISVYSQQENRKTDLSKQIAVITEHLRKAQLAKSSEVRKREILQAQNSVAKLLSYPLFEKLKISLDKVLKVGVMTKEADALLGDAIELAESANNLLRQKPSRIDPEEAKAKLAKVLSSREFRDPFWLVILRRLEKPFERILNWLGQAFGQLASFLRPVFQWISALFLALGSWFWHWFQLLMKISPILAWTILVVLILVFSALLAHTIIKWWRKRQKAFAEAVVAEALVMPEQLLLEAEKAAKKGDYLTAIRKAYKALLFALDRVGLICFREQRTNWEYLAEIQRKTSPEFALRFLEITKTFDLCFYARKLATSSEYTILKRFAEETIRHAFSNFSAPSS